MGRRATGSVEARENSIRFRFLWQGERVYETLTIAPTAPNMRAAWRTLAEIQEKIANGRFEFSDYFPDSARTKKLAQAKAEAAVKAAVPTFREIARRWMDVQTGAKSTIASYQTAV